MGPSNVTLRVFLGLLGSNGDLALDTAKDERGRVVRLGVFEWLASFDLVFDGSVLVT